MLKRLRLPGIGMHSVQLWLVSQQIIPKGHFGGQRSGQSSSGSSNKYSMSGHLSSVSENA